MGRKIEEQAKIANYLAGLKKGMSESGAASITQKTLFDYDDLTAFERYVLRRIFPFYTWTSKNATELQPWLLQNRPLAYSAMTKAIDALDSGFSREEDRHLLAEHLQFRVVAAAGEGKVVAGFGLPIEDTAEFGKWSEFGNISVPTGLISRMAPPLSDAFRFATGVDPYYGIDIERIRSAEDVRYLPKEIQDWVGFKEVEHTRTVRGVKETYTTVQTGHWPNVNLEPDQSAKLGAYRMALLRAYPAKRLINEYNKVMRPSFLSTVDVGSRGEKASAVERFIALTTGAKQYSADLTRGGNLAERRMRAWEERLTESLKDTGKGFSIDVLPKDSEVDPVEIEILKTFGIRE